MDDIRKIHSESERENKLTELYKRTFPPVARFVSKRGGSFEQAKDIFHDAMLIWYEKSTDAGFSVSHSEDAYLFGIAKFLWYRNFEEGKKIQLSSRGIEADADLALTSQESISSAKLLTLIETAGRKCLEILRAFYYDKLSLADLAAEIGFRSEHSASVQKYKCLEKVRETVKEKSLHYEDFLD